MFFIPETAYIREKFEVLPVEEKAGDVKEKSDSSPEKATPPNEREKESTSFSENADVEHHLNRGADPPKTFWQLLKPWNNQKYSDDNFFRAALRPFVFCVSPVVAWGTLVYGTTSAWCT